LTVSIEKKEREKNDQFDVDVALDGKLGVKKEVMCHWHFVNLAFCQLGILSTRHFVNMMFCRLENLQLYI
jgi:hypothetical protein